MSFQVPRITPIEVIVPANGFARYKRENFTTFGPDSVGGSRSLLPTFTPRQFALQFEGERPFGDLEQSIRFRFSRTTTYRVS